MRRGDWLSSVDRAFVDASNLAHQAEVDSRNAEQARKIDDANKLAAAERRAAQRTRTGLIAALALALAAGAFAWYALSEKGLADRKTREAIANQSAALTALANVEADKHPIKAAKLALAAWPRDGADPAPKLKETLDVLGRVVPQLRERVRVPSVGTDARFSPDGKKIVTASRDATARLFDAADGHELAVLKGHTKAVSFAAFSPDGKTVVTTSKDKTARLWDAATGREIGPPMTLSDVPTSAALQPRRPACRDRLRGWDRAHLERLGRDLDCESDPQRRGHERLERRGEKTGCDTDG